MRTSKNGLVVQLVRIHACHAWGRGFESRPDRGVLKQQKTFTPYMAASPSSWRRRFDRLERQATQSGRLNGKAFKVYLLKDSGSNPVLTAKSRNNILPVSCSVHREYL